MAIYRWIVCTPCSDKPMNGDMTKKRNSTKIWWYDGSNLQPGWTGKVWKSDDFSIESIYHLIVWRWPWVSAKKHCSCLLPIVWLETSNLWGIFWEDVRSWSIPVSTKSKIRQGFTLLPSCYTHVLEIKTTYPGHPWLDHVRYFGTWWLIPLSKWATTLVINGISGVSQLITGVITHLLSGINHQVLQSVAINDQW